MGKKLEKTSKNQKTQKFILHLRRTINPFRLLLFFIILQLLIGFYCTSWDFGGWINAHRHLDSSWYFHLAETVYAPKSDHSPGAQFAFLPLWPLLLKSTSIIFPSNYLHMVGAFLSLIFFSLAVWQMTQHSKLLKHQKPNDPTRYIATKNPIVLLPLFIAPGAWVFFSNHTEALFLFLSIMAFHKAYEGRLYSSSVWAGLSALTRNQGVVVSVCIGLYFLFNRSQSRLNKSTSFIVSGLISGFIYSLWLIFLYSKTGSIFASFKAQAHWGITNSVDQYLHALLSFLAPSYRRLWFWIISIFGFVMYIKGKEKRKILPITLYLVMSVLLWPMQLGSAHQAYRFSAVLFPFWLMLGHFVDSLLSSNSKKQYYMGIIILAYLFEEHIRKTSNFYWLNSWPY